MEAATQLAFATAGEKALVLEGHKDVSGSGHAEAEEVGHLGGRHSPAGTGPADNQPVAGTGCARLVDPAA